MLSLPDSRVVASVMGSVASGMRAGQLVIDTTTGDPQDAAALGRDLAARGVEFLEATIAGSSVAVRDGAAVVMVGGNREAFESALSLFGSFAAHSFHVGAWGSGSRMKLAVNLVLGLNRAALAEGLTLARSLGLDPATVLEILKAGPAYSRVMDAKGAKMVLNDFAPEARLSQHLKDVRLILAAAERTATHLPLSTVHRRLLEDAESAGWGAMDNSAIRQGVRTRPPRRMKGGVMSREFAKLLVQLLAV